MEVIKVWEAVIDSPSLFEPVTVPGATREEALREATTVLSHWLSSSLVEEINHELLSKNSYTLSKGEELSVHVHIDHSTNVLETWEDSRGHNG